MQHNLFDCETIVFGKGTGESILVRLSPTEWMLVDSCYNERGKPAALDYLLLNNFVPAESLKLIVISHFHDDHIKGLSEIISLCPTARVVISSALNTKEFIDYINAISVNNEHMAKTSEFKKIISHFETLKNEQRLILAKRDAILYRSTSGLEVHSLSPCDNDIMQSNINFVNELKIKNNLPEIAVSAKLVNPNNYCIVTKINLPNHDIEAHDILLGGDLEVIANFGWDAVCDAFNSPKPKKVGLFKLPHHGSQNGYHQRTWAELIKIKPVSLLTTYDSSPLPKPDMIDIYKNLSSKLYCTADPKKPKEKNESIEKAKRLLEKMNKNDIIFKNTQSRYGMIHVKNSLSPNLSVSIEGAATLL